MDQFHERLLQTCEDFFSVYNNVTKFGYWEDRETPEETVWTTLSGAEYANKIKEFQLKLKIINKEYNRR